MKKIKLLTLLLAFIMAFSLTACGGSDDEDSQTKQQGGDTPLTREDNNTPLNREDNISGTDIAGSGGTVAGMYDPDADLQSQIDSLNRNNLTPEQIADIEADAAKNGYEVKWNADGSMVIAEDGHTIDMSGGWPDNEFTRDVPAPKVGEISTTNISDYSCMIIMAWSAEDAKAYAEELKKNGYDKMVDEQDLVSMGVYTYSASNGEYSVSVTYTGGQGGIDITMTDADDLEYREENPDESSNSMTDDELQKQIEEAQKQLEGMDLPEGYEDVLGGMDLDNLDLSALMGGS